MIRSLAHALVIVATLMVLYAEVDRADFEVQPIEVPQ
jgi:hypothetical protein